MSNKTMNDMYNLYIYTNDRNLAFQEIPINELEKAYNIFSDYIRRTNEYTAIGIHQKGDKIANSGSLDLINYMDGKVKVSDDRLKSDLFKNNGFVNGNLVPRLEKMLKPNIQVLLECCYLYEDSEYKKNPEITDYRFSVEYDHCYDESLEDQDIDMDDGDFDFQSREELKEYIESLAVKANLIIDWIDEYRFYVFPI